MNTLPNNMPNKPKILIAVLSFNEAENIEATLNDLKKHNFGYDIVVIDDGSFDKTADIAKRNNVPVISHCINSGNYSNAAMTYFLYAYNNNYDILCQFDGDGQHQAEQLSKIIYPVAQGKLDVVIGSRFLEKKGFQSYFFRRLGINMFSKIDSKIIGTPLTDVTSGFRSYSKKIISFFGHVYKQELYDNTSQFLLITHYTGGKIGEVAIEMRARQAGNSLFNIWKSITFPLKGLVIVLGCILQKNILKGKLSSYEL